MDSKVLLIVMMAVPEVSANGVFDGMHLLIYRGDAVEKVRLFDSVKLESGVVSREGYAGNQRVCFGVNVGEDACPGTFKPCP